MILQLQGKARAQALLLAPTKAAYSFANGTIRMDDSLKGAECLLRGVIHIGVSAAEIGVSPYLKYGNKTLGNSQYFTTVADIFSRNYFGMSCFTPFETAFRDCRRFEWRHFWTKAC